MLFQEHIRDPDPVDVIWIYVEHTAMLSWVQAEYNVAGRIQSIISSKLKRSSLALIDWMKRNENLTLFNVN